MATYITDTVFDDNFKSISNVFTLEKTQLNDFYFVTRDLQTQYHCGRAPQAFFKCRPNTGIRSVQG